MSCALNSVPGREQNVTMRQMRSLLAPLWSLTQNTCWHLLVDPRSKLCSTSAATQCTARITTLHLKAQILGSWRNVLQYLPSWDGTFWLRCFSSWQSFSPHHLHDGRCHLLHSCQSTRQSLSLATLGGNGKGSFGVEMCKLVFYRSLGNLQPC